MKRKAVGFFIMLAGILLIGDTVISMVVSVFLIVFGWAVSTTKG